MASTQVAEEEKLSFIETSAKSNHNIDKVQYNHIYSQLIKIIIIE